LGHSCGDAYVYHSLWEENEISDEEEFRRPGLVGICCGFNSLKGIQRENKVACTQGNHDGFSHMETMGHAFDIAIPEGNPVLAAREGVVVGVMDDFEGGGLDVEFQRKANFVVIRHSDGTYGRYYHIAHKSCTVKQGDRVDAGDTIAKCGRTGFSGGAHVHFDVVNIYEKETSVLRLVRTGQVIESYFTAFSGTNPCRGKLVLANPITVPLEEEQQDVEGFAGQVVVCKRGGDSSFIEKVERIIQGSPAGIVIMDSDENAKGVLPLIGAGEDKKNLRLRIPVVIVSFESGKLLQVESAVADTQLEIGISDHFDVSGRRLRAGTSFCKPDTQPILVSFLSTKDKVR